MVDAPLGIFDSGVADVEDALVGQLVENGARDRETSDTAVEDAEGSVDHGWPP